MAPVRAVVLAAGRGVRMGGRRPKTLIPVADKQPLLRYILVGIALMLLMIFRPQGVFGNKKELAFA